MTKYQLIVLYLYIQKRVPAAPNPPPPLWSEERPPMTKHQLIVHIYPQAGPGATNPPTPPPPGHVQLGTH